MGVVVGRFGGEVGKWGVGSVGKMRGSEVDWGLRSWGGGWGIIGYGLGFTAGGCGLGVREESCGSRDW